MTGCPVLYLPAQEGAYLMNRMEKCADHWPPLVCSLCNSFVNAPMRDLDKRVAQ